MNWATRIGAQAAVPPAGERAMAACHACGLALDTSERVGFRATCEKCCADLHVCLNCRFHDPRASRACREPEADLVVEKDRSNRCDWFQAGREADSGTTDDGAAREGLDALFRKPGEAPARAAAKTDPRVVADALFKKKG